MVPFMMDSRSTEDNTGAGFMELRDDTQVKDELKKTLQVLGGNKLYNLVNQPGLFTSPHHQRG